MRMRQSLEGALEHRLGTMGVSLSSGPTHVEHFLTVLCFRVFPHHGPQQLPQSIHGSLVEKLKSE